MIELWVISFSLILARVGTFVALLPLFGGQSVPKIVKAGIAVALAAPLFMSFGLIPPLGLAGKFADAGWLTFALALGQEMILGAGLGYAFSLFLVPFRVAGDFISQEMGLSAAAQFDPTSAQPAGALTQIFETLGSVLFLSMDGHHVFLAALHSSFARWPIGGLPAALPIPNLVAGASATEELGVLLAGPVVLCLFLSTVVLGLMARTAPQMNIFSVGFALKVGAGLVAVFFLLPDLIAVMSGILGHVSQIVMGMLDGFV